MKISCTESARWRHRLRALATSTIVAAGMIAPGIALADAPTKTPIKHVVIIFQENITFDHYFATYPTATNPSGEPRFEGRDDTPAVNGLSAGLLSSNPNLANPFRLDRSEAFTCDMDHGYTDEQKAANGGLLNLFVQATSKTGIGCRPDGSTVMGYYDGNTVTALWNYAQHFAMSDNSFDTTFGPSTPGAINLVSGQTGGETTFKGGKQQSTGVTLTGDSDPAFDDCGADQGGNPATTAVTARFSGKNVGDLLNAKGVTWGWFQGGFAPTVAATATTPAVCGSSHTGHPGVPNPTAADGNPSNTDIHTAVTDYVPHHEPFQFYVSTSNPHHLRPTSVAMIGKTDQANHQYDISDFFSALQAHNLPAVSYLKAPAFENGHPGNSDPVSEQTFLVTVLNALQQSPEWESTAVIINYDDSDGWYDHVTGPTVNPSTSSADSLVPTLPLTTSTTPASPGSITTSTICGTPAAGAIASRCGYGPRLPFIVISPWAKENFVAHSVTDQTSSLAFIEANWNLGLIDGPTAPSSGQASFDRVSGSILNMFDFDDHPRQERIFLDPNSGKIIGGNFADRF